MPLNVVAVSVSDVIKSAEKFYRQAQPRPRNAPNETKQPQHVLPRPADPTWSTRISPGLWKHIKAERELAAHSPSSPKEKATKGSHADGVEEHGPLILKWSPRESFGHSVLYVKKQRDDGKGCTIGLMDGQLPEQCDETEVTGNVPETVAVGAAPHGRPPRLPPQNQPTTRTPMASPVVAGEVPLHSSRPTLFPRPPPGSVQLPAAGATTGTFVATGTNILSKEGVVRVSDAPNTGGTNTPRTGSARPWVREQVLKSLINFESVPRKLMQSSPRALPRSAAQVPARLGTADSARRLMNEDLAGAHCERCNATAKHVAAEVVLHAIDEHDCSSPREYALNQRRLHKRAVSRLSSARPNANSLASVSLLELPSVVTQTIIPSAYAKPHRESTAPAQVERKTTGRAEQLGRAESAVCHALAEYKAAKLAAAEHRQRDFL